MSKHLKADFEKSVVSYCVGKVLPVNISNTSGRHMVTCEGAMLVNLYMHICICVSISIRNEYAWPPPHDPRFLS